MPCLQATARSWARFPALWGMEPQYRVWAISWSLPPRTTLRAGLLACQQPSTRWTRPTCLFCRQQPNLGQGSLPPGAWTPKLGFEQSPGPCRPGHRQGQLIEPVLLPKWGCLEESIHSACICPDSKIFVWSTASLKEKLKPGHFQALTAQDDAQGRSGGGLGASLPPSTRLSRLENCHQP